MINDHNNDNHSNNGNDYDYDYDGVKENTHSAFVWEVTVIVF